MKTWLWWSSGKDSAWSLRELRAAGEHEVTALVTSVTPHFGRVAIHGVRLELLRQQARACGLPLRLIELPFPCSNDDYEAAVAPCLVAARQEGVEAMAFGDLFLEDIRAYRERLLSGSGLTPVFPLWQRDTRALAAEMIDGGLEARISCLDPKVLPAELAGRAWNHELLAELPGSVDPCGENGEFHTFCCRGPMLPGGVPVTTGEVVERGGFVFADLLPESPDTADRPDSVS